MRRFSLYSKNQGERCFPPQGRLGAVAQIRGSDKYPDIRGVVRFYYTRGGTVVQAEIRGLPSYLPALGGNPPRGPFGFHIHSMAKCGSPASPEPCMAAGGHFDIGENPHGNHAGDLPVLFSNKGVAMMSVYTSRFTPEQVIGRTVMIHEHPDDFRTQPAGDSGERIACGEILRAE